MSDSAITSSSTEPYDKEIDMSEEKILEHKTTELEVVNEKLWSKDSRAESSRWIFSWVKPWTYMSELRTYSNQ